MPWAAKPGGVGEETGAGRGALVVDLDIRQAGVVIDGRMDVVVAEAGAAGWAGSAVPLTAAVGERPSFLTSMWSSSPGRSRS